MNNPIRILQVFGIMNRGGAENMIMNLYRNIDKSKIQFDFIVHTNEKGAFDDEIKELGGKIHHCPKYKGINHFSYKKWWKSFLSAHKEYRIIHSHIRSTAIIYLRLAKQFNYFTISHSHSTSNGFGLRSLVKKIMQRDLAKVSDCCFACSKESALWLFGKSAETDKKIALLKNAIDIKRFAFNENDRNAIRKKLGLLDKIVFVHVGRFCSAKNHTFLIDLFSAIHKSNPNTFLILLGDGELKQEIIKKVSINGLNQSVYFAGTVENVSSYLSAADALLFPSKWEGMPVSVIEAQASGLRCFVSNKVTSDICVTDLVTQLPINEGPNCWVKAIESARLIRKDVSRELISSGYDIIESSTELTNFYFRVIYS